MGLIVLRTRYNDIVPYDANRVRLKEPLPVEEKGKAGSMGPASDYINASEISGGDFGFGGRKASATSDDVSFTGAAHHLSTSTSTTSTTAPTCRSAE